MYVRNGWRGLLRHCFAEAVLDSGWAGGWVRVELRLRRQHRQGICWEFGRTDGCIMARTAEASMASISKDVYKGRGREEKKRRPCVCMCGDI
jgi:hypothetical protein